MKDQTLIERSYETSREKYAEVGVDTDRAMELLAPIPLSLHCWQGDDVGGFEKPDAGLEGGGIMVTGNYPGKSRNIGELRQDIEKAYSLIPGTHRLNLHASYGEFKGKKVDRDGIETEHFRGWIDWAKEHGLKLDFNPTLFSHPRASSGFTLSSTDTGTRSFWIEHVKRSRCIASDMGRTLSCFSINNIWIPDGSKDNPANRAIHREILRDSLDDILTEKIDRTFLRDSVESKLFGIGSESYVVGSHEFYMGYALTRGIMLCLDSGHFHPTETIADKISAILQFTNEILLHISRGVRWDSDHVPVLDDQILSIANEAVSCGIDRVHIALDFFDASINRIGAWVIGARATLKAILSSLLRPSGKLLEYEQAGNGFALLALSDEMRSMPFGAVWDYYCMKQNVPTGNHLITDILQYEKDVLLRR